MNGEEIYVDVVAHEHANMDSLPFSYGFPYPKTSELRIYDVENKEFQSNNRIKLQAKFLDDRGEVQDGTFILIKTFAPNLKLVTVWRNDQQNEFYNWGWRVPEENQGVLFLTSWRVSFLLLNVYIIGGFQPFIVWCA